MPREQVDGVVDRVFAEYRPVAFFADPGSGFDESSLAHLDALTYGREYIAVGSGDCGTDDCPPLITAESP
ncbi:hypothetical protein KBZ21_43170, partial [Streptomyces sp. A73]|nr:hypothetical protein [Streptomyces sp. A73]